MSATEQWDNLPVLKPSTWPPTWLDWRNRRLQIGGASIVLALILIAAADTLFGLHTSSGANGTPGSSTLGHLLSGSAPVDPLTLGGWRENTTWVTIDPDAQLHHWLPRMSAKENGDEMDWARNKTVLLLGDSVLRDWIWRFCDNHLHSNREMIYFDGAEELEDKPEEKPQEKAKGAPEDKSKDKSTGKSHEKREPNEKTHSWECVVPETGMRLVNGFLYGMTDYARYKPEPPFLSWEWPPGPWGIEDRIPTLIEQYTPYHPDMIVVNSGPWDFKFLFKRDVYEGNSGTSIDRNELDEYGERLRQCMRMLRAGFPKSKLVFLQPHAFDANDNLPRWWWSKEMDAAHKPNVDLGVGEPNATNIEKYLPKLFTRRRVSQLAAVYRKVTAEEKWDELDYWKLQDHTEPDQFFRFFDAIHPSDDSIAVMLDWMLEKLWRWSVYG